LANKTTTIKTASDKELDDLLVRLRKENELQNLVGELKRKSSNGYIPYDQLQISTEEPIESLYHYGILGMHWGRRKGQSTRSGKKLKTSGSEDYVESRKLRNKGKKNLSTKELKDLTQRLQLEKQLKDLTPSDFKKGMNVVKEVTAVGTTLAALYAISKTPLFQDVAKAVKSRAK
jgi:hypothetical protein